MRLQRVRPAAVATAAVMLLAGCGSTVQGLGNNNGAAGNQGLGIPTNGSSVAPSGGLPGAAPGATVPGGAPIPGATTGTGTQFDQLQWQTELLRYHKKCRHNCRSPANLICLWR